jgi:hypothetical protein
MTKLMKLTTVVLVALVVVSVLAKTAPIGFFW